MLFLRGQAVVFKKRHGVEQVFPRGREREPVRRRHQLGEESAWTAFLRIDQGHVDGSTPFSFPQAARRDATNNSMAAYFAK